MELSKQNKKFWISSFQGNYINFPLWYSLRLQSSYWHSAVHSSWNRFWRHMSHGIHKMDFFGGWIYESFSFPVPSTISPFLSSHPLWHVSDCFCSWTWLETRECAFQIQSVSHCPENYQIKCWQESSIRYIPHQTSDSQWWTVWKSKQKSVKKYVIKTVLKCYLNLTKLWNQILEADKPIT